VIRSNIPSTKGEDPSHIFDPREITLVNFHRC
jgi:hypothetical protein